MFKDSSIHYQIAERTPGNRFRWDWRPAQAGVPTEIGPGNQHERPKAKSWAARCSASPTPSSLPRQSCGGIGNSSRGTATIVTAAGVLDARRWRRRWLNSCCEGLTRISHRLSTAAADPGMSTALRSVGLLDVLSSTSAGPSVALAGMRQMRLVSMPVCAASLRNPLRNAG